MIEIFGHRTRSGEDDFTQGRWGHAARGAIEKWRPKHVFQLRQSIGDSGLTACHVFGGACQGAMLLDVQ
jgi:hypothetical protein